MNRTLISFLTDEATLFTLGLEAFSPAFRVVSRPTDPLVYQLIISHIFRSRLVAHSLLCWYDDLPAITERGERRMLLRLARIHPEYRYEGFKRLCELFEVQLKFEEDLESVYEDDEKMEILIDVL
jgi:hypothetical protein